MRSHRDDPREGIPFEDVDDVIGLADELERKHADRLPLADLYAVGEDLGVSAQAIDRARGELIRRREEAARAQAAKDERRRRRLTRVGMAAGALVAVVVLVGLVSTAGLRDLHAQVEAQRARVQSVIERRAAIGRLFEGQPDSTDKTAELVGAENRVRVETSRYQEAAAAYNAVAGQNRAWLGVRLRGLPSEVPLRVEGGE